MNSEKEIIALKEEQRMALASNAMECLHQNLCDAGCSIISCSRQNKRKAINDEKTDLNCFYRIDNAHSYNRLRKPSGAEYIF